MTDLPEKQDASTERAVQQFATSQGARIYQIPTLAFPGLWGCVYLVLLESEGKPYRVLIDAGSGFGEANQQLEAGLQRVSDMSGEPVSLANLTHVLITHGHIDHFGGLSYVRPRTPALVGVHELDYRVLTNYEERLSVVARRLSGYLIDAGVSPERRDRLIEMYLIMKSMYHSVKVDFTYEAAGMQVGPFELLHTPGHCAGHTVIRLHDVLFSGDHILAHTSPHQSPEHLTLSTGLTHYLTSLEALRRWAGPVRLTLGGHEQPVYDLHERITAIIAMHHERLAKVLELLAEPHTIAEVSQILFGKLQGYNVLLGLEEAGAHVEYLYSRGKLGIANLNEIGSGDNAVPVQYYHLAA